METCPHCQCESYDHEFLGSYNVRCQDCGREWNMREVAGLSKTHCEACNMRLSWGCGHETHHEIAARDHRLTREHYDGKCDCFTPAPGYIPPTNPHEVKPTFAEWVEWLATPV